MKKVHVRQNEFQMVRSKDLNHHFLMKISHFFNKKIVIFRYKMTNFQMKNDRFLDIFDTKDP